MKQADSSEGKVLIIVESPTKARTIKKFLPPHCTVLACNGHVRDLPSKNLAIDVANGYAPQYEVAEGKEKILRELKSELAGSRSLMLATDEDREGESISWHLLEVLKPRIPYRRMVFHEITRKAIQHALANGRDLDMQLVNAQEARRILDRLYGYTLSPFLWKKLSTTNLSAGRVQSPGLRLIVERERERMRFCQSTYWDAKALLRRPGDDKQAAFEASLDMVGNLRAATGKDFDPSTGALRSGRKVLVLDQHEAEALAERLSKGTWTVSEVEEKQRTQRPSPPFITSTLQQEANRKLKLGTKETMRIAQKLYESGLITYMRTDSPALSDEGTRAARDAAGTLFGMEYLPDAPRRYAAKSESAQEAHEAIRPAGDQFKHPDETGLKGKELSLYDLIWKRTLASQMADAVKAITTVKIDVEDARFSATGNRIVFPGFIRVYVEGKDDPESALEDTESWLPRLEKAMTLALENLQPVSHETKPPARYTEATLVQELEKLGIGRPSTYAAIIDKLFERSYVAKDGTALIPTFTGFAVVQLLERSFQTLVDYAFTSTMETALDGIATGTVDQLDFLKSFYEGEQGLDRQVKEKMEQVKASEAKRISIPALTGPHQILIGRFGPYVLVPTEGEQKDLYVAIPRDVYPGTVTDDDIRRLVAAKVAGGDAQQPIGTDPDSGMPVYLFEGKFGPYFQLGLKTDDNPKPKRASVPKGLDGLSMPLDAVCKLLALPKTLGMDSESGEPVVAGIGKYGPYVSMGKEYRSLPEVGAVYEVTLEQALELLRAPKQSKFKTGTGKAAAATPVKEFGEHGDKPLAVHLGRYGYYGKWGKDNFALPAEMKKDEAALASLDRTRMIELAEASAASPQPAKKSTRKSPAKAKSPKSTPKA